MSPSGEYLAFMSSEPLTGYNNHDTVSGMPDEEVFLYDATTGKLVCASCNLGSAPHGVLDRGAGGVRQPVLYDETEIWAASRSGVDPWIGAIIPGWTAASGLRAYYQSRYLLNSGQLFFDSPDALVPADANGNMDVYEYRPSGEACSSATQGTSEIYREEEGGAGCVALISSGTSSQESVFLDSSTSAEDVFFLTSSRLSPTDIDESFDVYDAHVCSGAAPCPAPSAGPPAPCNEESSCRSPAPPATSLLAPTSATFSGFGNLPPSLPASKPLTNAQKLSKALRVCRVKPNARKRKACEAAARRRYPVKVRHKVRTKLKSKGKSKHK